MHFSENSVEYRVENMTRRFDMQKKYSGVFSVADLTKAPAKEKDKWNSFSVPPISERKAKLLYNECHKRELVKRELS